MAFNFSPKTVTDGLVLALDAANPKSYVSGSSVWSDLTANNYSRNLVNGPTFSSANGGSIVFDGIDDYTTIILPQTKGTIDFWYYFNQGTTQKLIMGAGSPFSMIYNGGIPGRWHWWNGGASYEFGGLWNNVSQWINMSAVYESDTNNSMYINGVLAYSSTSYSISKASIYNVAGNMYNPQNTRFSTIRTYNRALSAAEILQNYNATKGRFGLT
jgi:hypothetical protein